jgi:hypothetical protein
LDWSAQKSQGFDQADSLIQPGGADFRGLSLPRNVTGSAAYQLAGYTAVRAVAPSPALTTGLTFKILLTDDGSQASDLGKVVRIGITAKRLVNDEVLVVDAGAAGEQTVDVTLSATTLGVAVASLAITAANLDSPAVGDFILIRLRRVATAAQDTCMGRVVFLGAMVSNT